MGYLDTIIKQSKLFRYKKGELIIGPDDSPHGIYYVEKGYVRVYSLTEWGDEKLHLIFKQGEFFPLFWIFDSQAISKYYEAMDEVMLRRIPKDEFLDHLKKNSDALNEFMQRVIKILEVYSSRIDSLEYTNAYARLISRLLYLAQRFGEKQGTGVCIMAPISHKDLASSIATTRETASREFEKLEKKKIIRYENHRIFIPDIILLKKEMSAHFDKHLL